MSFATLLWPSLDHEGGLAALLRGNDDFMRMVQVVDWLDGQAWDDLVQHRLNPPHGSAMHWSRIPDLPLAGAIALAEPVLGRASAQYLAALLVPPLLGGVLVACFFGLARTMTPTGRAVAPLLMVPALLVPLAQFRPGRIDHHGVQLVLLTVLIGLLLRTLSSGKCRPAAAAGLVTAVSLAVGLENLPLAMVTAAVFGLAWMRQATMAAPFAAFALALLAASAALAWATVPAADWSAATCDRFSLAHLAATAGIAVTALGALALRQLHPGAGQRLRVVVGGCAAATCMAVVAAVFPECARSPYGGLAPEIRYWFDHVSEARAFHALFVHEPGFAATHAILPLAALVFAGVRLVRCRGSRAELVWMALFGLAAAAAALGAWQVRGAYPAGVVAAVVLLPLATAASRRADRARRLAARLALRLGVPALCVGCYLVPTWIEIATETGAGLAEDAAAPACDVRTVLTALTHPAGLGSAPRIVAAPIDLGPDLLLLTRHSVLAAPYHRNVDGLADHRRVFAGTEAEALATIARRDVDAVLFCRKYASKTTYPDRAPFLSDRLAAGRPPDWLRLALLSNDIGLYRVDLTGAGGAERVAKPGSE